MFGMKSDLGRPNSKKLISFQIYFSEGMIVFWDFCENPFALRKKFSAKTFARVFFQYAWIQFGFVALAIVNIV
jgi:hypothetical protein